MGAAEDAFHGGDGTVAAPAADASHRGPDSGAGEGGDSWADAFDSALEILAEGNRYRPLVRKNKAMLLAEAGEHDVCERLTRDLSGLSKTSTADARSIRGHCLAGLGRRDEAEPLLHEGSEALRQELGENARLTRQAAGRLVVFVAVAP